MEIQVKINEIKEKLKTDDEAFDKQPYYIINNRQIAFDIINYHPDSFVCVNQSLRNDKELVTMAVSRHAFNLMYTSDELKNDRDIVLIAVKNDPSSLEYASNNLKNDKEVVLSALTSHTGSSWYFQFAGNKLKQEVANEDPVDYLEKEILKEKLKILLKEKLESFLPINNIKEKKRTKI